MSKKRRRRFKKPPQEPIQVQIESLNHDGRGVTHVDGKATFVDGALPGEEVVMRYARTFRRYDEGQAEEILIPSPDRVEPRCSAYAICGGCSLQHLDEKAQIRHKQTVLIENLQHIGHVKPEEILPPLTGPHWGYRRKARLGVRNVPKKGRVLVGFRERYSSFIADIESCPVLHPSVGERLSALSELIGGLDAASQIPQIEVAISDDEVCLVVRHLQPLSQVDLAQLETFARQAQVHLQLQPKGPDSVVPLWPAETDLSYALPEFDLELHFLPTDFTQVNTDINRAMVHRAVELLEPQEGERVLDLFCGIGNFTLPLARRGGEVVGVEGSDALVARALENAIRNGLENVTFHAADLTADLVAESWVGEGFEKILLDPPRSGAIEFLKYLKQMGPKRIVYVSCNPATLARDAGELVHEYGYRLLKAGVMDMFPHTGHVESIAVFEPA